MEIGKIESGTLLNTSQIPQTKPKYYKRRKAQPGNNSKRWRGRMCNADTFCDISSRQEKLLKTLQINQTCKKYYHIYTPVATPIPSQ